MLINLGEDLYLDKDGKVTEDAEESVSLLVARGSPLDEGAALRHAVTKKLTPESEVELRNPVTGQPIVSIGGRSYAKNLFGPPNSEWGGATPKSVAESLAPRDAVEAKHVAGPGETKARRGPKAKAPVADPAIVPPEAEVVGDE